MAFHVIPPEQDSRYQGVVVIGSLADIHRAAHDAALTTGAVVLFGTLLFGWIVHRIASGITRPIAALAHMASRLTHGEREVRVHIQRDDEIGRLAAALNAMAGEIANYENKLAQSSKLSALGQMSARIAHEVRNPLTAIKLHLQILQETLPDEFAAIIKTLLDEVRRLELIVSGILDLGRPIRLNREPSDLNALVREMVFLFEAQLQHRRIVVEMALESGLPLASLDRDRIKQVLLNLLTNACDALPAGGKVAIATRRSPAAEVVLCVEDSGSGIAEAARERIFLPTNSSKAGGLGLGLSLSKELIELHQGRIEVGAGRLGGALFTIHLPVGGGDTCG